MGEPGTGRGWPCAEFWRGCAHQPVLPRPWTVGFCPCHPQSSCPCALLCLRACLPRPPPPPPRPCPHCLSTVPLQEIKRIQAVPLVIGQFMEMIDTNYGIVSSTTGST